MSADFYVYDDDGTRRRVLWSEATAEDHAFAIERFTQIRDEVQAEISRHDRALRALGATS